jgi:hypothetical protein
MKLVPVTFPHANHVLTTPRAARARFRENGPIRITLRAIESTPRANDGASPLSRKLLSATAARPAPTRVAISRKTKTATPNDVLLMLL